MTERFEIWDKHNINELIIDHENIIDGCTQIYGVTSIYCRLNELDKKCKKLEKENEQLKNELSDTKHQLDNIFRYRRQREGKE